MVVILFFIGLTLIGMGLAIWHMWEGLNELEDLLRGHTKFNH